MSRYPIAPLWARAVGTSLVSVALGDTIEIVDEMGPVKPNVFIIYLGPSGTAYKTPIIQRVRDIMTSFDPGLLCPSKFILENFIIRDEYSKIFMEKSQKHLGTMQEYISEIWDGWIEGYYTRKYQFEGNILVYVTLLSATSPQFLKYMEEDFFTQGLGCRFLWIVVDEVQVKKVDPDEFFFPAYQEDVEYEELKKWVVQKLQSLLEEYEDFLEMLRSQKRELIARGGTQEAIDSYDRTIAYRKPTMEIRLCFYCPDFLDVVCKRRKVKGEHKHGSCLLICDLKSEAIPIVVE